MELSVHDNPLVIVEFVFSLIFSRFGIFFVLVKEIKDCASYSGPYHSHLDQAFLNYGSRPKWGCEKF